MSHREHPYQPTEYSVTAPSHVYCFAGAPGVGKSTISEKFIEYLCTEQEILPKRVTRFRTDEIRKEIYDDPQYTTTETKHVYFELCHRVRKAIFDDMIIICDATFSNKEYRERLYNMALMFATQVTFFHVTCPDTVSKERIRGRENNVSDADVDVYETVVSDFDNFCVDDTEYEVYEISTDQSVSDTVNDVIAHAKQHRESPQY